MLGAASVGTLKQHTSLGVFHEETVVLGDDAVGLIEVIHVKACNEFSARVRTTTGTFDALAIENSQPDRLDDGIVTGSDHCVAVARLVWAHIDGRAMGTVMRSPHESRSSSRMNVVDWRGQLALVTPQLARQPASVHAVNLLCLQHAMGAARAACEELLDQRNTSAQGLVNLADRFDRLGASDLVIRLRRAACEIEMADYELDAEERRRAVEFCLAADGLRSGTDRPPRGYFRELFDRYAETFERRLVGELDYCGPSTVYAAVSSQLGSEFCDRTVIDLGCGTGLAGPLFRRHASRLDGIDLSAKMLQQARGKSVYDQLWTGDLIDWLQTSGPRYDLILAIDVLIYLSDLSEFFLACRQRLARTGYLAVTIESGCENCRVGDFRRYVHGLKHAQTCAEAAGMSMSFHQPVSIRRERGKRVDFFVMMLGVDPRS